MKKISVSVRRKEVICVSREKVVQALNKINTEKAFGATNVLL